MGKLRRGTLWALFPPAGAVASMRAGRRHDTQRIVDAIEHANQQPEPQTPAPISSEAAVRRDAVIQRKKEIDRRLQEQGFSDKAQRMRAHMQVIRLVSEEGRTVDEAVSLVAGWLSDIG